MARATIRHRAPRAVRFAYRPFPRSLGATRLFEDTRSHEVGDPRITCEPAGAGKLVVLISMQESSLPKSTSVGEESMDGSGPWLECAAGLDCEPL